MLNVVKLNVILSAIKPNVTVLNIVMPNVTMLSAVKPNVVMLSVVGPKNRLQFAFCLDNDRFSIQSLFQGKEKRTNPPLLGPQQQISSLRNGQTIDV
jgi:hypothetical protein